MPDSLHNTTGLPLETMVLPEDLQPDNPLWQFALLFWQNPLAQETCLALQSKGWSVTRILCAGWFALNGMPYSGIEEATVTEWRDRVTGSLRAIRMSVPKAQPPYSELRKYLASLELEAERIELALAWRTFSALKQEQPTVSVCDDLIQSNLTAAAPVPDASRHSMQLLVTLRGIISSFQSGVRQTC